MKNKVAAILFLMLSVLILTSAFLEVTARMCQGGFVYGGYMATVTQAPLTETEKQYLKTAIDEEYFARAAFRKVIATFGPINPFSKIVMDEQMHINMVAKLFIKYGLPVPGDPWAGKVAQEFTSRKQACEVGAQAEINNAAAFDEMLSSKQITHNDLISVFIKLRNMSQYKHLPAFRYWANIYAGMTA